MGKKPRVFLLSSNLSSQFPAMFPNALGALTAYLRREGYEVGTLHIEREKEVGQVAARLRAFAPDVVGFSVMSPEENMIEPLAAMAKAYNAKVPFLVGGVFAVLSPEETARMQNVDMVCTGEGEEALLEYLQRIENGEDVHETDNFAYINQAGEFVRNKTRHFIRDLDSLPFFDRTVADFQLAIDANRGTVNLVFGRGCPNHCKFCGNRHLRHSGGGSWARMPSPMRAIREIEELSSRYKFREIVIRDDTFSWNKVWASEFLDEYAKRFAFPIHIFSRADSLTEELVAKLKKAHCSCVFIGLDSGAEEIRNGVLEKNQSNEDLLRTAGWLKAAGITPVISNIVGLPYETAEHFKQTIEINRQIYNDKVVFVPSFGAVPKIWVFSPWRGSELYHLCKKEGWLREYSNQGRVYRDANIDMPAFPAKDVIREFRHFRYNVYKDNFPFWAMLFLAFDSAPVQWMYERVPMEMSGGFTDGLRKVLNFALGSKGAFVPDVQPPC